MLDQDAIDAKPDDETVLGRHDMNVRGAREHGLTHHLVDELDRRSVLAEFLVGSAWIQQGGAVQALIILHGLQQQIEMFAERQKVDDGVPARRTLEDLLQVGGRGVARHADKTL